MSVIKILNQGHEANGNAPHAHQWLPDGLYVVFDWTDGGRTIYGPMLDDADAERGVQAWDGDTDVEDAWVTDAATLDAFLAEAGDRRVVVNDRRYFDSDQPADLQHWTYRIGGRPTTTTEEVTS